MNKKKFKSVGISLTPEMVEQMKEVVEKRDMTSVSDLVRDLFRTYYEGTFRKTFFGYQSGLDTSKRRIAASDFKSSTIGKVLDMDVMNDEEATKFIHEIGYINADDLRDGMTWSIHTDTETGVRTLRQRYANGNFRDVYTLDELKSAVRKHLSDQKKRQEHENK